MYSSTSSVVTLASIAVTSGDVSALSIGAMALTPGIGPSVHVHSRTLFRRPATGVSGHLSLSDSSEDESRFSPTWGPSSFVSDGCRRCLTRRGPSLGDDASFGATVAVLAFAASTSMFDDSDDNVVVEPSDALDERSRSEDTSGSSCSNTMSMCATVYFVVWTSSVKGSRKDTLF